MNSQGYSGTVANAELCVPLAAVEIVRTGSSGVTLEETRTDSQGRWHLEGYGEGQRVTFALSGYVAKTYSSVPPPAMVRLLEDRLIGYQDRLWFLPGETVTAYVHSSRAYSARLFRHGLEKKCLLDLGPRVGSRQNVPDGYFVEMGLRWTASFEYQVPGDATPGIYSLLLDADGDKSFAIPMVVSTPREWRGWNAKLLVLASTNNWQTYNLWGGRSRYRNFEDEGSKEFIAPAQSLKQIARRQLPRLLPAGARRRLRRLLGEWVEPAWIFKRLSVRRPTTSCGLEQDHVFQPFTNHLAGGEWRVLAWLEREGISYDVVSGAELHRDPDLMRHYRGIVLSTHCEYWSKDMFEGLRRYHEGNGLWILNLSGNAVYREVEFFDDGSIRCNGLRFERSCADETEVLGVRFTAADYGTCAPYKILRRDHWVFDGVPFRHVVEQFGGMSLNQNTPRDGSRYDPGRPGLRDGLEGMGASGWETDKLSKTAPGDFVVVAKGMNRRGGADMVVREADHRRGGVFSGSSIVFGGTLLIDNVSSIVVRNAVRRALQDG